MSLPSTDSALIVPVALPGRLEALRRRGVRDAAIGLPAHITLLYPFVRPDEIDPVVIGRVEAAASGHAAFRFRLVARREWPGGVVFAGVEPEDPFRSLFDDLAAAFPHHPLHGGAVPFVPHVTVGEGDPGIANEVCADRGWAALPVDRKADAIDLIVRRARRWGVERRFALVGP